MVGKRTYSCILFFAIIVLTSQTEGRYSFKPKHHFVLVHGSCHGAWCWYKLQPLLEAAGHRVTAIDLAASGIDLTSLDELRTFVDYTKPLLDLMESIPEDEKIVLVGHSMGGINLAFAMEQYPLKIFAAVFVTAFMPDTVHSPAYINDQFNERYGRSRNLLDTEFAPFGRPEDYLFSILFGPKYSSVRLYQLSPPEDLTLAKSLLRPSPLFDEDLTNRRPFSNEKFGSVKRAYVVCKEDKANPEEFQRWMIENTGVDIVKEIEDADHMAMISKPEKLYQCLLEIADSFSQKLETADSFSLK